MKNIAITCLVLVAVWLAGEEGGESALFHGNEYQPNRIPESDIRERYDMDRG